MTSLEIAEEYGKGHNKVLESIRNILKRHPEHINEFTYSSYINKQNKHIPCYILTKNAINIIKAKYELGSLPARLENSFKEFLDTLFPNEKIIFQYPILNYRIDFYFEELNFAVEYDEDAHKYQQVKDINRESEITMYFKNLKKEIIFIRVKEGKEAEGIKKILEVIGSKKNLNNIFNNSLDS